VREIEKESERTGEREIDGGREIVRGRPRRERERTRVSESKREPRARESE